MRKIAIVFHVGSNNQDIILFYIKIIETLCQRLQKLSTLTIQIFVTISDHLSEDVYQMVHEACDNFHHHSNLFIKTIANRGCDVGPFIDFILTVEQNFDFIIKIHTKTDPEWSLRLISIFDQIDEVFALLDSDEPKIGVVGHISHVHPILIHISDSEYRKRLVEIFHEFGVEIENVDHMSMIREMVDPVEVNLFEYRNTMMGLWRWLDTDEKAYKHIREILANIHSVPPYLWRKFVSSPNFVAGTIFAIRGDLAAKYKYHYTPLLKNYYNKMATGHPCDSLGTRFRYTHTFERVMSGLVARFGYEVYGFQPKADYPIPNFLTPLPNNLTWTQKYWQFEEYLLRHPEAIAAGQCGLKDSFEHYMKIGYQSDDTPATILPQSRGRKRVTVVIHEATLTGAPMTILNIACGLQEFYEINIISMKPGCVLDLFVWENPPIIIPRRKLGFLCYLTHLELGRRLLKELNPDLLIVNSTAAHVYFHAGLERNTPMIYYGHECLKSLNSQLRNNVIPFADFGGKMIKHHLPKAPVIYYCPNQKIMQDFLGLTEAVGTFKNMTEVINLKRVISNSKIFKEKFPVHIPNDGRIRVGMVATICHRKGWDLFIKAAEQFPQMIFIWVGDDIDKKYQPHGNLIWIESTDNPHYYMNQLDYFVLSAREDMCPLVVVESLYLGVKTLYFDQNVGRPDLFEEIGAYRVAGNVEDDLIETIENLIYLDFPEHNYKKIENIFGLERNLIRFRQEIDHMLSTRPMIPRPRDNYSIDAQYGHTNYCLDRVGEHIHSHGTRFDAEFYLSTYRDLGMIRSAEMAESHYRNSGYHDRIGHSDDLWKLFLTFHPEYLEQFIDSKDKLDTHVPNWNKDKLTVHFNWKKYIANNPNIPTHTHGAIVRHWRLYGWRHGRCIY